MPTNPVDDERARSCVRCERRFTEPAGTVTRICDACRRREMGASGASNADDEVDPCDDRGDTAAGDRVVARRRERACIRCAATFVERRGEVTRLCPSCDPDHVVLD